MRYRTIDIARAIGVHPNTVRLYEKWGLIPSPDRSPAGYRLFGEFHLDMMRLAWTALHAPHAGARPIAAEMVRLAGAGDIRGALGKCRECLESVRDDRAGAEAALSLVEKWAGGREDCADQTVYETIRGRTDGGLRIREAAAATGVTPDALRNWERNGLVKTRRETNGYRYYTRADLDRLKVISVLRSAGYGMMSILRMMSRLDSGATAGVRQTIDTPDPHDDVRYATDRWLSTLAEWEERALRCRALLEEMSAKAY